MKLINKAISIGINTTLLKYNLTNMYLITYFTTQLDWQVKKA